MGEETFGTGKGVTSERCLYQSHFAQKSKKTLQGLKPLNRFQSLSFQVFRVLRAE